MEMDKKEIKKIKLKNKKLTLVLLIILLLTLTGSGYIAYTIYQNKMIESIHNNLKTTIKIKKNSKIYDSNKKEIATTKDSISLELSSIKKKAKYYKIKNTDFYINYKDIKNNTNLKTEKKDNSIYESLQTKIKIKSKVDLIKNNKKTITLLKGITVSLDSIDDNYFYINFLNQIFKIKKDKSIKQINKNNNNNNNSVSVIHYDKINNTCQDDNCLLTESVKRHIELLKNNNYYFITKDDYIKFVKGYINLKENAILLTTSEENEFVKSIENQYKISIPVIKENDSISFITTNKKSERNEDLKKLNRYQPTKYTVIDDYLKMAKGEEITPTNKEDIATDIPVVNYHFFFDSSLGEKCNESICLEASKFEEHLKWITENNYKALTINEFTDWKEGLIELPKHSVLLTIDDGGIGTSKINGNKLIPLLEKYKQHATLFFITAWGELSDYQSPYLDVQSHSFDLHYEARCPDGRGMVACSDYKTVKEDLEKSLKILSGDNTSFCFPFYSYDKESLQALKDLNFRIAFIGGNRRANRNQNNYLITRFPILDDITLDEFVSIIK